MEDLKKQLLGIINEVIDDARRGERPKDWSFLHPDIKFMEGYKNSKIQGEQNAKSLIEQMAGWGTAQDIQILSSKIMQLHTDSCMLICIIEIEKKSAKPEAVYSIGKYTVKFSFLWKQVENVWKILYIHMSQPEKADNPILLDNAVKIPDETSNDLWLQPKELLYVEAKNVRSELHFRERLVMAQESLSEWEKKLPDYFLRIHRSYLVNTGYITRLERYCVHLIGGDVLPVPAKKYSQIRRQVLDGAK